MNLVDEIINKGDHLFSTVVKKKTDKKGNSLCQIKGKGTCIRPEVLDEFVSLHHLYYKPRRFRFSVLWNVEDRHRDPC